MEYQKLWRIAMQQVMVDVMQFSVAAIFPLVAIIALLLLAKHFYKQYKVNNGDIENVIGPSIWVMVFFGVLIFLITEAVSRLINPEYYVIEILMGLVQ